MGYVLQITDTTGGGAGRATTRLHHGLLDVGVDSRLLCRENHADIKGVHTLQNTMKQTHGGEQATDRWNKINGKLVTNNRTSISNTMISLGYPGFDISDLPVVRDADVLHLHWTPRILSVRGIESLLKLGKPTFWTQHDRWPTTPGYHFQASEAEFAEPGVSTTHLFQENDLAALLLEDKRISFDYPNLHIVCLTEQLAELYRTRSIFSERQISTVANGIETDKFRPFDADDRMRARSLLGIEKDTIVFLLLSQNGQEKRKGYAHAAEALRAADAMPSLAKARDEDRLLIATIGAGGSEDMFPGLRSLPINTISDDEMLTTIMNASDALIMPSEQESFSLAVLESLSCGLPVITFSHGGMPEKEIRTGENGILIEGRPSPKRLAQALDLFCSNKFDREKCRAVARQTAEQFDIATVASDMLKIYQKDQPLSQSKKKKGGITSLNAPQIKHFAPFDYAPSEWLGRQPVESAIADLFAAPNPPEETKKPAQTLPQASAKPAAKPEPETVAKPAVKPSAPQAAPLKPAPQADLKQTKPQSAPPPQTSPPLAQKPAAPLKEMIKAPLAPVKRTEKAKAPQPTAPAIKAKLKPVKSPSHPLAASGAVLDILPEMRLTTLARRPAQGGLRIPAGGREGHCIFGPYIHPLPGLYKVAIGIDTKKRPFKQMLRRRRPLNAEAVLDMDRVLDDYHWRSNSRSKQDILAELEFRLTEVDCATSKHGLEVRIWTDGLSDIAVSSMTLQRWDS